VALAVLTLVTLIVTIVITVADRRAAELRLEKERKLADGRILDERRHTQQQEQEAEAWAVGVLTAVENAGPMTELAMPDNSLKKLVITVQNQGAHTITRVSALLSPDGENLLPPHEIRDMPGGQVTLPGLVDRVANTPSVLIPKAGLQFVSDGIGAEHMHSPFAAVEWTDWRGTRWRNSKGSVEKVTVGNTVSSRAARPPADAAVSRWLRLARRVRLRR
jgi:hypothetical protein